MQIIARNKPKTFRLETCMARQQRLEQRRQEDAAAAEAIARRLGTSTGLNTNHRWGTGPLNQLEGSYLDKIGDTFGVTRKYAEGDDGYRERIMNLMRMHQQRVLGSPIGSMPPHWGKTPVNPGMTINPNTYIPTTDPGLTWTAGTTNIGASENWDALVTTIKKNF